MNDDLEKGLQELLTERGKVAPDAVDRALGGIDALPERRPTRRSTPLAAAAVVALAVIGLALAVLLPRPPDVATPSPSPLVPSQAPSTSAAVITPEPTPTVQPRPVWAIELASHLDCDGPVGTFGNDVASVPQGFDPAPTPDAALRNVLVPYTYLPVSGYSLHVDGHWALHRYLVDGRPKVHIVSTNHFPGAPGEAAWDVVGVRGCDPSEFPDAEFGPNANMIWHDASGDPVRTDMLTSQDVSGCFPNQTFFLLLFDPDYKQYVRDPSGHFTDNTLVPFDADVRLPTDAVDTGLRTDDWHLFTIPSRRAVFIRTSDGTYELWPRAKEPVGCM
jgi:hypothetical protein